MIETEFPKITTGVYIFAGICSFIGNFLVISATVVTTKHQRTSNFRWLMVHLAICDLIFTLCLFTDIPKWIYHYWIYSDAFCKIFPSFQLIASLASECTVVVIALDRYNSLSQPLKFRWSHRHLVIPLLLVWIFSIASVSPYFVVLQLVQQQGHNRKSYCVEVWNETKQEARLSQFVYSVYLFLGSFFLPLMSLVILYGHIVYAMQKGKNNGSIITARLIKKLGKDIRITKMLAVIVVAYASCTLPNNFGDLGLSMTEPNDKIQLAIHYVMMILYSIKCMINPLIYLGFDKQFQDDVKTIFLNCYKHLLICGKTVILKKRKMRVSSILVTPRDAIRSIDNEKQQLI